jgi:hypothetical protein
MSYAMNIFQSAYTQARGSSGQRLVTPHLTPSYPDSPAKALRVAQESEPHESQ